MRGTHNDAGSDHKVMSCEDCREAISDMVDDRLPSIDPVLEEHLEGCAECREFADMSYRLRRRAAIADAPNVPDLSKAVVRNVGIADRERHSPIVRWLLVLVAIQIVVFAVPDFLATDAEAHALSHLGAFSLAYAFGLVVVAIRPARARTMLGVSLVLIAALLATAVEDIITGRTLLVSESVHLLEVCSAFLVWLLTRPGRRIRQTTTEPAAEDDGHHAEPSLRLVTHPEP